MTDILSIASEAGRKIPIAEIAHLSRDLTNTMAYICFDCFDTILWRRTSKPTDVFFELQAHPLFMQFGISAAQRVQAEHRARQRKIITHQTKEVKLAEIYQAHSTQLSDKDIDLLVEAELEIEKLMCFAYLPTVQWIKSLIAQDKKIIIVSDTYLSSEQLRQLLASHLTEEITHYFSHIFVSCEHGLNKVSGLHTVVMNKLRVKPQQLLHVGDHPLADFEAPNSYGITAIHLEQYDPMMTQMTRMRELGASMLLPEIRTTMPLYHPFKALLSAARFTQGEPDKYIGYASLGPLMYAFAQYLKQEYAALKEAHPDVKVLYLLRDGHLPYLASQSLNEPINGVPVRISRFAAYASSFRSKENILDYVSGVITGNRYEDICKQLLLDSKLAEKIIAEAKKTNNTQKAFISAILNEKIIMQIIVSSRAYCQRLRLYLKKHAYVEDGDTIMLVDLGYSGTTQSRLAPIFKNEFNITLIGRYLISLRTPDWQLSRAGLIDPTNCTDNTLHTLVSYVSLLEQLCTTTDKSVINFDEQGEPIYGNVSLNNDQYRKLSQIQAACLEFIKAAEQLRERQYLRFSMTELQQIAVGEIARLLYLPSQLEMKYLKTFKFDLNLGTDDLFDMFDADKGLESLQKRGLFFMEKNAKSMRTNYPAELRYIGLDLLITLVAQHTRGLEFNVSDMSYRQECLEVILINGMQQSTQTVTATSTYDGYFTCTIPLMRAGAFIGILFGKRYQWVQIKSIEAINFKYLYSDYESQHTLSLNDVVVFDQMKAHSDGLYECQSAEALTLLPCYESKMNICRVTFRPISYQQ